MAALIALPAAGLLAGKPLVSTSDVAVMLWLGVVATGIAYLLFSAGLRWVSSATGVALALAEPITAVILAVLIVGERPAQISYMGLLLMFTGLSVLVRSEMSDKQPLAMQT
jgi:DME family drug/metabolite transporter